MLRHAIPIKNAPYRVMCVIVFPIVLSRCAAAQIGDYPTLLNRAWAHFITAGDDRVLWLRIVVACFILYTKYCSTTKVNQMQI